MVKNTLIFEIVQNDLLALENELLSIVHSSVDLITDISSHLVRAGGKRLRPALYLICARNSRVSADKLLPVAAAIELIHMATLVHDDVIDNATTRRGIPTANTRWGNHKSVLSGDYLFAKAFSIIATQVNSRMLKVLTDVICSMCEGEIMQLKDAFNPNQSESEYFGRIAQKTADFIAASCELGGISAELSSKDIEALRQYGYSIGMAFQITDDILDITSSSEQIGKPAGNDLRQGIVTLPIIYALTHSSHSAELKNIVLTRDMSDEQVKSGLAIIHSTDAIDYSYRCAAKYLQEACAVLPASLSLAARETLMSIADFVGLRNN